MYCAINGSHDVDAEDVLAHFVMRREPRKVGGVAAGVRSRMYQGYRQGGSWKTESKLDSTERPLPIGAREKFWLRFVFVKYALCCYVWTVLARQHCACESLTRRGGFVTYINGEFNDVTALPVEVQPNGSSAAAAKLTIQVKTPVMLRLLCVRIRGPVMCELFDTAAPNDGLRRRAQLPQVLRRVVWLQRGG